MLPMRKLLKVVERTLEPDFEYDFIDRIMKVE